jgi:hypothetical protein
MRVPNKVFSNLKMLATYAVALAVPMFVATACAGDHLGALPPTTYTITCQPTLVVTINDSTYDPHPSAPKPPEPDAVCAGGKVYFKVGGGNTSYTLDFDTPNYPFTNPHAPISANPSTTTTEYDVQQWKTAIRVCKYTLTMPSGATFDPHIIVLGANYPLESAAKRH